MSRESQYRSFIKVEQGKKTDQDDAMLFFLAASGLERIECEVLILNIFIITWSCLNKKYPRDLLDMYTVKMYERLSPSIPEEVEIIPRVHLTREALLKTFEEDWLGNRFKTYYEAIKNLGSDSGVWEIGKTIVGKFGGNVRDYAQALKAGTAFIISLKHVGNYLDNFEIE